MNVYQKTNKMLHLNFAVQTTVFTIDFVHIKYINIMLILLIVIITITNIAFYFLLPYE